MPKIKMLEHCKGSDCKDGIAQPVKAYVKGDVYSVCDSLAKTLCDDLKVAKRASVLTKKTVEK